MDKFRGTLSAQAAVSAAANGVRDVLRDAECVLVPLGDGGEGTLEVLGGANRTTEVTGPLGDHLTASWRLQGGVAIIEMALASGLELVGGAEGNDPLAASSSGTGMLIKAALGAGAKRIIVTLGGSATTDGGLGALQEMRPIVSLKSCELLVACDVETLFCDAAKVFAPQKGASPAQVELLTRRLESLADHYHEEYGIDVREVVGGGAAGGLGGGLAAVGAQLVSGFDAVADELDLDRILSGADLVITGEGLLDPASFQGKVVGGVHSRSSSPVLTLVGDVIAGFDAPIEFVSLVKTYGLETALGEASSCLRKAAADAIGVYLEG